MNPRRRNTQTVALMADRDTWNLQRDTLIDRNALKMEQSGHGQPEARKLEKLLITSSFSWYDIFSAQQIEGYYSV